MPGMKKLYGTLLLFLVLLAGTAALAAFTPVHPAWLILAGGLAGVARTSHRGTGGQA